MKKFVSFFTLSLFAQLSFAKLDLNRPEAQPNIQLSKSQKFFRDFYDFIGIEPLGIQQLLPHNEQYIRGIITNLKMDEYCIEIRGMSNLAQRVFGRVNAFVYPSAFSKESHSYLYISEDWFETLSDQEKQALVRHELMHLKLDHNARMAQVTVLSLIAIIAVKIALEKKLNIDSSNSSWGTILIKNLAIFKILGLLTSPYSRMLEKEADIEAAKTMQSNQGFLDLFTGMRKEIEDPESKFAVLRFADKIDKYINSFFSTHPDFDERIEYIKNL